jgi:hypothetical protein
MLHGRVPGIRKAGGENKLEDLGVKLMNGLVQVLLLLLLLFFELIEGRFHLPDYDIELLDV